ncbi:MAG: lysophospholipid acyltransferase family protein [Sphingomonadales bacterium]|jgi:1-acyl-sn-glycerol-3-phosphate acyltransferase
MGITTTSELPPLPDASGFVAPPVPGPLAALAALARACARDPAGALRVGQRSLWLLAVAAICVPLHALCRKLGLASPWARRFLGWGARACGIRVSAIGAPCERDVVFIANHLSWTDALILGGQTGAVFVAQDGIAIWPGLVQICRLNDTIFVNRGDRMGVTGQIAAVRAQFARHGRIAIFPEATCSDGRRLLPFKPALFAMLAPPPKPEAVIQPVVIDCDEAGRDLAWLGLETGAANAWRVLARPGTWAVRVHFLPPISAADAADRKALAAATRAAIAAGLAETLGRPVA